VRQPDAQTDPSSGHVGPVNDLVACGSYICSAGGLVGATIVCKQRLLLPDIALHAGCYAVVELCMCVSCYPGALLIWPCGARE
jgi:hypothetical protein